MSTNRARMRALRTAVIEELRGGSSTELTGDGFERAIERAFGCQPLPDGRQRTYGAIDRWDGHGGAWMVKTLQVERRHLDAIWPAASRRRVELPGEGAPAQPVRIEFHWSRESSYRMGVQDDFEADRPDNAGEKLLRKMGQKIADSAGDHEVDPDRITLAFGLRHRDGRMAYTELPYVAFRASDYTWAWVVDPDKPELPTALEGESSNGAWVIRWFPDGGHVRVRMALDLARLARFTV
jgi:hypothetical protein